MKYKQSHPGFELELLGLFPTTVTITPQMPPKLKYQKKKKPKKKTNPCLLSPDQTSTEDLNVLWTLRFGGVFIYLLLSFSQKVLFTNPSARAGQFLSGV